LTAKAGDREAAVTLVNHPVNGTLFAGPQQEPFVCENEAHGLAPATDASCAAPTVVTYFYRDKRGEWKPFDAKAARPADIATTRTTEGKDVPLIVRQEKGVINRSAYVVNILHDPAAGALPTAFAGSPGSGWNGKLVYSFGGGVQANYHMGRGLGGMTGTDRKFYLEELGAGFLDDFVTRGYAVAAGSLNVMGTNNDDVKSADCRQDQGALHQGVRSAAVHHRPWRFGWVDAAAPDRQQLSRPARRHHAGAELSGRHELPAAAV
jgi:Tannase-like family of unknown function (DUF6351)